MDRVYLPRVPHNCKITQPTINAPSASTHLSNINPYIPSQNPTRALKFSASNLPERHQSEIISKRMSRPNFKSNISDSIPCTNLRDSKFLERDYSTTDNSFPFSHQSNIKPNPNGKPDLRVTSFTSQVSKLITDRYLPRK